MRQLEGAGSRRSDRRKSFVEEPRTYGSGWGSLAELLQMAQFGRDGRERDMSAPVDLRRVRTPGERHVRHQSHRTQLTGARDPLRGPEASCAPRSPYW